MNVTLRQIDIFLAVARSLSFSDAAQQCCLSQPALSASVKRLEAEIGARLFDRHTRKVALTAVGQELLAATSDIQAHVAQAMQRVQDCVLGHVGRLSIAVTPTLAAAFAPPLISEFKAIHMGVDLRLHAAYSDLSVAMLRRGDADIALVPYEAAAPDLLQEPLFRDPLVVLLPPGHPLTRKKALRWGDLRSYPHIMLSGSSNVRKLIEDELAEHGVPLQTAYEVNHGGALLGLVAASCGIAILPESAVFYYNLRGVEYRRIQSKSGHRLICATTLESRSLSPMAASFKALCVQRAIRHPRQWLSMTKEALSG
jgi:LysR family carnitine catabolism transcriptional activator